MDEEQALASSATPSADADRRSRCQPASSHSCMPRSLPWSVGVIFMVMIMIPNFVCNTIAA